MRGDVLVKDVPVTKVGTLVATDADIRIRTAPEDRYVSRGALKLVRAIEVFEIHPSGRVALDVGASTGGFTQVLLEKGASRVIALDVGHNQIDWRLRSDPRVEVLEHVNARTADLSSLEKPSLITIDVSFISLELIVQNLIRFFPDVPDWITLIKPQFEVGPERVGKGGIVRNPDHRTEAVDHVTEALQRLGLTRQGLVESPISGAQGNIEFLAHWSPRPSTDSRLRDSV